MNQLTNQINVATANFERKARAVHGDRYDYSQVEYIGNRKSVIIGCKIHGLFQQAPTNHLAGKGCRKCASELAALRYKKTTEQFVSEARQVHGDLYDYSLVDYENDHKGLIFNCLTHGKFTQSADSHLRGAGCPKCSNEKTSVRCRHTSVDFITKATEKFGNKFNYSNVKYETSWVPVEIVCPVHGSFLQAPIGHLVSTHGCRECAYLEIKGNPNALRASNLARQVTTSDFVTRAKAVHGDRYDYSLADCRGSKSPVTIICPNHGPFQQVTGTHLSGRGCNLCGNEAISAKQLQPVSEFIARAQTKHGFKFDYSLVNYRTARLPVEIICPVHGVFSQNPDKHLRYGCRKCADEALPGAYTNKRFVDDTVLGAKIGVLYYVRFEADDGEAFYKVGISKDLPSKRFAGYAGSYGYKLAVLAYRELPMAQAYAIEQLLMVAFVSRYKYLPLRKSNSGRRFGGRTECFGRPLPEDLQAHFVSN